MNNEKPYSDQDYQEAKILGLDLDNWDDYKHFYKMEEFADKED